MADDVYRDLFIPKDSVVFANIRSVYSAQQYHHCPYGYHNQIHGPQRICVLGPGRIQSRSLHTQRARWSRRTFLVAIRLWQKVRKSLVVGRILISCCVSEESVPGASWLRTALRMRSEYILAVDPPMLSSRALFVHCTIPRLPFASMR